MVAMSKAAVIEGQAVGHRLDQLDPPALRRPAAAPSSRSATSSIPDDGSMPVTRTSGQRATAAAANAPVPQPMSSSRVAPAAIDRLDDVQQPSVWSRWIGDQQAA